MGGEREVREVSEGGSEGSGMEGGRQRIGEGEWMELCDTEGG